MIDDGEIIDAKAIPLFHSIRPSAPVSCAAVKIKLRPNSPPGEPWQGSGCRELLRESRKIDREALGFCGRSASFRHDGVGRRH
jgi:hypothetical protein